MKGRAGHGGPGIGRPGCRWSVLRPELHGQDRADWAARPDNSRGGPTVSNGTRWVGIDLHRNRSHVAVIDEQGGLTLV
jgi:hypothetical protein